MIHDDVLGSLDHQGSAVEGSHATLFRFGVALGAGGKGEVTVSPASNFYDGDGPGRGKTIHERFSLCLMEF